MDRLVQEFEACTLDPARFSHEAHVFVAWSYLRESALPEAMIRYRDRLKSYAASVGAHNLYNETITFGFLLLLHDRMRRGESAAWESFRAANEDLLKKNLLRELYGAELGSELAKKHFLLPSSAARRRRCRREERPSA